MGAFKRLRAASARDGSGLGEREVVTSVRELSEQAVAAWEEVPRTGASRGSGASWAKA